MKWEPQLFLKINGNELEITSRSKALGIVAGILILFFALVLAAIYLALGGEIWELLKIEMLWISLGLFIILLIRYGGAEMKIKKGHGTISIKSNFIERKNNNKSFSNKKLKLIVIKKKKKYFLYLFDGFELVTMSPLEGKLRITAGALAYCMVEATKELTNNTYLSYTQEQTEKISKFLDLPIEYKN